MKREQRERGDDHKTRVGFSRSELPPGGRRLVKIGRREIAVFNVDGHLYAIYNRCPHQRAPLIAGVISGTNLPSEVGRLRRGLQDRVLKCPWHHYEYDLDTGRCVAIPGNLRVATYEVREEGEEIAIYC